MHFIKRKVLNYDSNFSNTFPTGRDHFGNERQRANGSLLYQVQQQSGTKPNLVAKFWLPNLVLYQTDQWAINTLGHKSTGSQTTVHY